MNGGAKFLSCSALLLIGACGGEAGKLEVRAMPTPLAQGKQPVPFRVAEANAQMALGNVALALEAYRKAAREDPTSIAALAGIAACYDRMGRFDLSRRHYEAALALDPDNGTILAMLAASLDQQGRPSDAALVRNEIRQRIAAAPRAPASAPAPASEAPVAIVAASPPAATPTVAPKPLVAQVAELALPRPQDLAAPAISAAPLAASVAPIAPAAVVAAFAPDEPEPARQVAPAAEPVALAQSAPARSVTITLPPPRPAAAPVETPAAAIATATPPAPAEAPKPAPVQAPVRMAEALPPAEPVRPPARQVVAAAAAPRLERLSMGEVALVSPGAPQWASLVVKQDQRSATVRFVPLQNSRTRFASVRLLNAARVQGLAARTRGTLLDRGWRGIAIGDARTARAQSVVLYPAHRRATALSLARQFGFKTAQRASGREITVLLGRDAAALARRAPTA